MKRKELDTLRSHSAQELGAELRQAREKKLSLSFKHASAPLPNPLELRKLRRRVAVLETVIREKGGADKGAGK